MSFKQAATNLVHEALDGQIEFIVLRGVDDFAREDGDIDVLVPCGCSRMALLWVAERAFDGGWTIAGVSDIGYLTQICLVQRWGEDRAHRAVKVDFFNGVAWAALGQDPLGRVLFEGLHKTLSEAEAIGLATLLQKMLYAGYLRDRDRNRIEAACSPERIKAFIDAMGLPLSQSDLNRGHLSSWSRWRLRAASAGVGLAGMSGWGLSVIWRTLRFTVVRSIIPGRILWITGPDGHQRAAVIARFQSILESAGFPSPSDLPDTDMGRVSLTWRRFRGETVVLQPTLSGSSPTGRASWAPVLQVQIPKGDGNSGDDLERVLTALSRHILETLPKKLQS